MKAASVLILALMMTSLWVQASDITLCSGTVLQRRLALVELGRFTDAYVSNKGALPDICVTPVAEVSGAIPDLLKSASVCGSSEQGFVYYSCQMPNARAEVSDENTRVIESCRYSLANQSVSCENRSIVTTFGDR